MSAQVEIKPGSLLKKLDEVLSPEDLIEAACRLGTIKRQRKVDLPALVRATVLAMSPIPGMQTTIMTNYLSLVPVPMAPSSFYDRFSEPFAALMGELARRALRSVRETAPEDRTYADYGVLFETFSDVRIAD